MAGRSHEAAGPAPVTEGHSALLPPPGVPPHTLILGTHPSVESLKHSEYYGHRMNAFWWIAGAALGFRRDPRHEPPANIAPHLPDGLDPLPYEEQCARLTAHGFAVWDVLGECSRKGSLDSAIAAEGRRANDVPALLERFPTIRRVCFSSGASTAQLFLKHQRPWLSSAERAIAVTPNPQSLKVFGKQPWARHGGGGGDEAIVLCVMLSVSPAFANPAHGGAFPDKLAQWMAECFAPGLEAHRAMRPRAPCRPLALPSTPRPPPSRKRRDVDVAAEGEGDGGTAHADASTHGRRQRQRVEPQQQARPLREKTLRKSR